MNSLLNALSVLGGKQVRWVGTVWRVPTERRGVLLGCYNVFVKGQKLVAALPRLHRPSGPARGVCREGKRGWGTGGRPRDGCRRDEASGQRRRGGRRGVVPAAAPWGPGGRAGRRALSAQPWRARGAAGGAEGRSGAREAAAAE